TTASSRTAQEPGAATAKPSRTQPSLAVTSSATGACAGTKRTPSPRTSTLGAPARSRPGSSWSRTGWTPPCTSSAPSASGGRLSTTTFSRRRTSRTSAPHPTRKRPSPALPSRRLSRTSEGRATSGLCRSVPGTTSLPIDTTTRRAARRLRGLYFGQHTHRILSDDSLFVGINAVRWELPVTSYSSSA
ncbi:unnamed protein product, partial [Pylaiella littoralis]